MKKSFDFQQWLPVAILAVAAVVLYVGLTDKGSPKEAPSARSKHAQDVVNRHLERTAEQLEMQRTRMKIENSKLTMDYYHAEPDRAYVPPAEGTELKADTRSENVAEDLGLERRRQLAADPMSAIHQQLFEEQRDRERSDAYKKEYARQFIENARRGGYEVQLSDDYRVLSVKPIRRAPSRYED